MNMVNVTLIKKHIDDEDYTNPLFFITVDGKKYKLIRNKIGRVYFIEEGDTFYEQRLVAGPYQGRNIRFLRKICPDANVIVDVGMNIGCNVIEYATWAKTVLGFEPFRATFKIAQINVELNKDITITNQYKFDTTKRLSTKLVNVKGQTGQKMIATTVLHNTALGEQEKTIHIVSHKYNSGQNFILEDGKTTKHTTQEVSVKPLDSFNLKNVDILKIDTEGYELNVLKGGITTLLQSRPIIQVEIADSQCKRYGYTPQDVYDYIFTMLTDYDVCTYRGILLPKTYTKEKGVIDYFFVPKERQSNVIQKNGYSKQISLDTYRKTEDDENGSA